MFINLIFFQFNEIGKGSQYSEYFGDPDPIGFFRALPCAESSEP